MSRERFYEKSVGTVEGPDALLSGRNPGNEFPGRCCCGLEGEEDVYAEGELGVVVEAVEDFVVGHVPANFGADSEAGEVGVAGQGLDVEAGGQSDDAGAQASCAVVVVEVLGAA